MIRDVDDLLEQFSCGFLIQRTRRADSAQAMPVEHGVDGADEDERTLAL